VLLRREKYGFSPEAGSDEARLMDRLRPRDRLTETSPT
jgi:hypothetical protein